MMIESKRKQQSAMEYLMTYGWSILIIAIVLAALYSLGVFGNSSLGPRAQPNSCRVYRPNGPGTTIDINLEGVCNGELPKYVAQLDGSGYIGITPTSALETQQVTITAWYYIPATFTDADYDGACGYPVIGLYSRTSCFTQGYMLLLGRSPADNQFFLTGNGAENEAPTSLQVGSWIFMAGTVSGTTMTTYINGKSVATGSAASITYSGVVANVFSINTNVPTYLSNVQIYNTGLDANAIQALYLEGIGGAPIEPQNLVAWWPLNGDTNDYSGNNNNGVPTNVMFTSSWTSGYTIP